MGDKWFNLLQACMIVGTFVWFIAISSEDVEQLREKVETVSKQQYDREDKLVNILVRINETLQDSKVDRAVIHKDIERNTARIDKLENWP
jgi:hypothetical protein